MSRNLRSRVFYLHHYLNVLQRVKLIRWHQELLLKLQLIRKELNEIIDGSCRITSQSLALLKLRQIHDVYSVDSETYLILCI